MKTVAALDEEKVGDVQWARAATSSTRSPGGDADPAGPRSFSAGSGVASSPVGILPQQWGGFDGGQPDGGKSGDGTRSGTMAVHGLWGRGSLGESEGTEEKVRSRSPLTRPDVPTPVHTSGIQNQWRRKKNG